MPVQMFHLMQHRYNFRLQDNASPLLSWRPFGCASRDLIEPDSWLWLDRGHWRRYASWIWWTSKDAGLLRKNNLGFRQATKRFVANVPDRLEMIKSNIDLQNASPSDSDIVKLGLKVDPSRSATLLMISHCMEDLNRDRDRSLAVVGVDRRHEWLNGWRGL